MRQFLLLVYRINLFYTIYLNFKYFKPSVAIKLPIWVFGKLSIHQLKGQIILEGLIKSGMVKIGGLAVGIFDRKMRTVLNIHGTLIFKVKAKIGRGSKLSIGKGSQLEFGENFVITAKSTIVASGNTKVTFGNNCLLSWNILVMSSDFHSIHEVNTDFKINAPKDIFINNHVWIGCNSTVLKGSEIAEDCIIAAESVVVGKLQEPNSIYGGNTAKKIRGNINWQV